jgi:hypothetical protein
LKRDLHLTETGLTMAEASSPTKKQGAADNNADSILMTN